MSKNIHDQVSEYYGQTLESSSDLKTNACCTVEAYPSHIKSIIGELHDEVVAKYYGCGLTIPENVEGTKVLDLGCGAGRDVYILSKLVGRSGHVAGVDMTVEQLEVAKAHQAHHAEHFGYSNVDFHSGKIERLLDLPISKGSLDIVVSNCVINLAMDKKAVFQGAFELLKEGGELYFSDVYADRRVPEHLVKDPELYGECLSGALYWNDFLTMTKEVGFKDPRLVESSPISIGNESLQRRVGDLKFYSLTYRLMKIDDLEADCEDYGHCVTYLGGIPNSEDRMVLDEHHVFEKGKREKVCGNSYLMIEKSRFAKFFKLEGNFDTHLGIFEGCGGKAPFLNQVGELPCC